jgi:LysR family glycine cleavage system transcriptional activator
MQCINRTNALSQLRRLPPIASLVAFEAAARCRSFTRAAEELGLTQGAISHHVRQLERDLETPLFFRLPRSTPLTDTGQRLAEIVRRNLTEIADAADAVRHRMSHVLTVSVLPGFAYKWLFSRLPRFEERHPDIELRFSASAQPADFASGEADVAIRYGRGGYAGLHVEQILGEEMMFPVCSRRLLDSGKPLRRPQNLDRQTLLHDDVVRIGRIQPGWRAWLREAGVTSVDADGGRRFGLSIATIQAAIDGQGVALGRTALVCDDLAAGTLVCPFGPAVPSGFNYYFVCPRPRKREDKIRAFREWLVAEASDMAQGMRKLAV